MRGCAWTFYLQCFCPAEWPEGIGELHPAGLAGSSTGYQCFSSPLGYNFLFTQEAGVKSLLHGEREVPAFVSLCCPSPPLSCLVPLRAVGALIRDAEGSLSRGIRTEGFTFFSVL